MTILIVLKTKIFHFEQHIPLLCDMHIYFYSFEAISIF